MRRRRKWRAAHVVAGRVVGRPGALQLAPVARAEIMRRELAMPRVV